MAGYNRLSYELQRFPSDVCWGLHVYRATYEDQDLWERYIEYVWNAIMSSLQPLHELISEAEASRLKKLRDSLRLVIRENESWDGLTLYEIRDFLDWGEIPSDGDQPEPNTRWITGGMNYDYFIYVDEAILMDFKAIDDSRRGPTPNYFEEKVAVIVVQRLWEYDEDTTAEDWQYVCALWLSQFYNLTFRDSDAWCNLFVWPPEKWNRY